MNIDSKSTKGITVIEVLIIVAIFLLVGAGIYQIFSDKTKTNTVEQGNEVVIDKKQKENIQVKTNQVDVKVGEAVKKNIENKADLNKVDLEG